MCTLARGTGNGSKDHIIVGNIFDAQSKMPIEYASVALYDHIENKLVGGSITDDKGKYQIHNVGEGQYYLQINFIGFKKIRSDVFTVGSSEKKYQAADIFLQQEIGELANVNVVGKKMPVAYKLDKKIIDGASNIAAEGGTAINILERVPSVALDIDGNITLRGSSNFMILIDGRPSLLSPSMALEQIPASEVDNIEIITNPSARYDAQGDAGIINVITKKGSGNGLSGVISANTSTFGTYGLNAHLNHKKKHVTWRFGGSLFKNYRVGDFKQVKETIVNDTVHLSRSEGERTGRNYNSSLKAGLTYEAPRTTYTIDFEGGDRGSGYEGNLNYLETHRSNGKKYFEDVYDSYDYKDLNEDFFTGNIGFFHWIDEKDHHLSGSFFGTYGYSMEYFENDKKDDLGNQQDGQRSWEEEFRVTLQGKLDYVRPINGKKGKIELGYQYYSYVEDGDYGMKDYDVELGDFIWREEFYSIYRFERAINALYGIISNEHGKFGYQAGLRSEHTHRVLESSEAWASHVEHRFELFPSIHVFHSFPKDNQVKASYSRRTVRPNLHYMEPYVTFADSYTARTGNPYVRPEYVQSFELGYQKNIGENTITLDVFHRYKTDKIERIRTVYGPNITLDSISNVGDDFSTGAELAGIFSVSAWWDLNVSASLFHYRIESIYKIPGIDDESLNWEARCSSSFFIGKSTQLQFDGNYVGPSVSTQGIREAFFYTNLSWKQHLMHKKMTFTASARDFLSTAQFESTQTGIGLNSTTLVKPKSPLFIFSLSYRINNLNWKKSIQNKTDNLFEGAGH
ncbi:MAG: TonB-dependent receptor [Cytophagales bacterium]|nr:TonB-dependent receptor [Cytophagales bacterium]